MNTREAQLVGGGCCGGLAWLFRSATTRLLAALLVAALLDKADLCAQTADSQVSTNEVQQSDETAADGAADALASEDMTSTNSIVETNTPAVAGPDGRTRRLRRRRPRSSTDSGSNLVSRGSGTNGTPASLDYSAFRLVAERKIFDPNRSPRSFRAPTQPKTVDSFSLVGTMSYEKGDFAFFDGSSSDYKKVLKTNDVIAGYKILVISPELVKIESVTNQLELRVGAQMRRREDGSWERAAGGAAYAASSTSSNNQSDTSATGAESDVIKKMMQRREKE